MLANRNPASEKSNADAQNQRHRHQRMKYFLRCQKIHHISDKLEFICDIYNHLVIQHIQNAEWNRRSVIVLLMRNTATPSRIRMIPAEI